mmetsp:Transcript_12892/g.36989  ORF Transcript_12892/g.36989 Transcript_12892/m.36989 type:complete len:209 (-) Transcript_12892:2100-2726(-)
MPGVRVHILMVDQMGNVQHIPFGGKLDQQLYRVGRVEVRRRGSVDGRPAQHLRRVRPGRLGLDNTLLLLNECSELGLRLLLSLFLFLLPERLLLLLQSLLQGHVTLAHGRLLFLQLSSSVLLFGPLLRFQSLYTRLLLRRSLSLGLFDDRPLRCLPSLLLGALPRLLGKLLVQRLLLLRQLPRELLLSLLSGYFLFLTWANGVHIRGI